MAQVIIDPAREQSIERIRELEKGNAANWIPATRFNFGYSKARYWLKISLTNRDSNNNDWLMEFGYPLIHTVHFYQFTGTKQVVNYKTGRLLPFGSRPVNHHNFLFSFSAPEGMNTDLYVMAESLGTVFTPMTIYTQQALLSKSIKKTTAIGVYVGIIVAMVIYNLFLFMAIRDRNYLFYIAYAATFCLLLLSLNGMTYQYLWPNWARWNRVSIPVLVGISYLFLALFTKSFLETKRTVPRLDIGLDAILAGAVFLILGGVFNYGLFVNRFTSIFISIVPLFVIPISARCVYLGSRTASYYLIAFGCFFLGSASHAVRDLGWLPQNFVTENGPYLGSAAEMIGLSLGLAVRIKTLREGKLKSELQAAEAERELAKNRKKLDQQLAVSALASQVAHDIKSPLAALAMVEKDLSPLGEGTRILVRGAVSRIRDIANNLIEKNREIKAAIDGDAGLPSLSSAAGTATVELLSSHIEPLITEKRMQFRSKIGIEIDANIGPASYGLFACIVPAEFKRGVSNLINNAVEAMGEKGLVTVDLAASDGHVALRVQDNGKGIPPDILARLGQRGETHGKAGGSGLGLHHAKLSAEAWGGAIEIQSELGKGTVVSMRLPQMRPPAWFVAKLELEPGATVVVLDDDSSVHQVWQGRFDSLRAKNSDIKILHFSEPAELRGWVRGNQKIFQTTLYLTDYELLGYQETGLDLVEELKLGNQAILVTSRFEERKILDECLRLKVRMIPKGLAGFVPIAVQALSNGNGPEGMRRPNAVLLDDDTLVHMTWKIAAKSKGFSLLTFRTPQELLAALDQIPKDTPVYLDCELGNGIHGKNVARDLHAQGFSQLYLATGYAPESLPSMPWIKRVVGKEPPWA